MDRQRSRRGHERPGAYRRIRRAGALRDHDGADAPAVDVCARHPVQLVAGQGIHGQAAATGQRTADRPAARLRGGVLPGVPGER